MVEDSLTDEDEVAEIDEDNLRRESVRRRGKVGLVANVLQCYNPRQAP